MRSLHDAVAEIQNTQWTLNNNFYVQLLFGSSKLAQECGLSTIDINLYIKDCIVPQVGSGSTIEHFTLDRFRIAMGVWDPVTITLKFRDYDNLSLYKKFVEYASKERFKYFDEYKFGVKLTKLGDYADDASESDIVTLEDCYITTVSQLTFSNDAEAQVLEFDVAIKSASIEQLR